MLKESGLAMANLTSEGTAYAISGPDDAPCVVLVHGLGLNRQIWDDFLGSLSSHYRVLSYDLYGHGESALPPSIPSLSLFATQLSGLLSNLKISTCAIIGFSLGGMINRRFALDYPERVNALVILNSPHERSPQTQRQVEQRAAQADDGGPGATLDVAIERWFTTDFRKNRPEYILQIRRWIMANDPVTYTRCRQVLANGILELVRPNPPIRCPALVITCEHDSGSTPAMSQMIGSEIVGAQTRIIPGHKHMGLVEEPELFLEPIKDFLAQNLPTTLMNTPSSS